MYTTGAIPRTTRAASNYLPQQFSSDQHPSSHVNNSDLTTHFQNLQLLNSGQIPRRQDNQTDVQYCEGLLPKLQGVMREMIIKHDELQEREQQLQQRTAQLNTTTRVPAEPDPISAMLHYFSTTSRGKEEFISLLADATAYRTLPRASSAQSGRNVRRSRNRQNRRQQSSQQPTPGN